MTDREYTVKVLTQQREAANLAFAQEAAAANQSCSFATCSPAQLAVGGDEPVLLAGFCQRGSPAGQPVVGAFGARSDNREQLVAGALADQIARRPPVEDDHYANAFALGQARQRSISSFSGRFGHCERSTFLASTSTVILVSPGTEPE